MGSVKNKVIICGTQIHRMCVILLIVIAKKAARTNAQVKCQAFRIRRENGRAEVCGQFLDRRM